MLIDFFYTLRSAKLPVSVREFLTLLEALQKGVVGPNATALGDAASTAYTIDDFYYLSRTTLVKDEKNYDKFDRAFASYFKGVEAIADFTRDIPLEWLRKNLELNLSPEERAKIEKWAGMSSWKPSRNDLKSRRSGTRAAASGSAQAAPAHSAPLGKTHKASGLGKTKAATRVLSRCGINAPTRITTTPRN